MTDAFGFRDLRVETSIYTLEVIFGISPGRFIIKFPGRQPTSVFYFDGFWYNSIAGETINRTISDCPDSFFTAFIFAERGAN